MWIFTCLTLVVNPSFLFQFARPIFEDTSAFSNEEVIFPSLNLLEKGQQVDSDNFAYWTRCPVHGFY